MKPFNEQSRTHHFVYSYRYTRGLRKFLRDVTNIITVAQPKAGTGHKMQTVSVVFSTLHFQGYIADLRNIAGSLLLEVLAGSLKSYLPFFLRHGGLFLRGLNKKNSMLKKFVFKKISMIEIQKSSKFHRYVNKVRKLYHA